MKVDRIIKLTFDSEHRCHSRKGTRTIVKLKSYFREENFDQIFAQLGFTTLPEPVRETLKKYGYKYDYKLGGWATTTTGIVNLNPNDEDNQYKANNIATSKAKSKAYDKAKRCIKEISSVFYKTFMNLMDSLDNITYISDNEINALDRCIETGYCNPNKQ